MLLLAGTGSDTTGADLAVAGALLAAARADLAGLGSGPNLAGTGADLAV